MLVDLRGYLNCCSEAKMSIRINVRENRRDNEEWTNQRHRQHWPQEKELRPCTYSIKDNLHLLNLKLYTGVKVQMNFCSTL
jgi:hypothetical protein